MHVFFACLYGVTLVTYWFVPESAKWLSTRKGRKNRKKILKVLGTVSLILGYVFVMFLVATK